MALAYNGTAPVEVSSGNRRIYRLSLKGNRRLNHAIHMAAITQIRHKHSDGRAYYERKIAEGKTHKEALRCLKRRISDAIYAALLADARQAATACPEGPGGQPGNLSVSGAAGCTPRVPALRTSHSRASPHPTASSRVHGQRQLTSRRSNSAGDWPSCCFLAAASSPGRAGRSQDQRPAGRTTLTPGRPARYRPSEEAGGGMRAPGHRTARPVPGTAAGDSSRTTPVRNRRPKSISKKPRKTP